MFQALQLTDKNTIALTDLDESALPEGDVEQLQWVGLF